MGMYYLYPISEAVTSDWTLAAGANKTAAVAPGGPPPTAGGDADTSYLTGVYNQSQAFNMAARTFEGTITAVRWRVYARVQTAASLDVSGFATSPSGIDAAAVNGGGYGLYGNTLSRPGGGSWVQTDFDGIVAGFTLNTNDVGLVAVTSFWLEIDVADDGDDDDDDVFIG